MLFMKHIRMKFILGLMLRNSGAKNLTKQNIILLNFNPRIYLLILEGRRGRVKAEKERETEKREKHRYERETSISCLMYVHQLGIKLRPPRYVP